MVRQGSVMHVCIHRENTHIYIYRYIHMHVYIDVCTSPTVCSDEAWSC